MTVSTPNQRQEIWALQPDLLNRALAMTSDVNEAHRLVTSALLRAWRSPGRPNGASTAAWLCNLMDEAAGTAEKERRR